MIELFAVDDRLVPAKLVDELPVPFFPSINRDNSVKWLLFRSNSLQAYLNSHG